MAITKQTGVFYTGLLLVLVNLLPIYAVLFLDWDVASLVVLYWSENLIIGFYTLLKMLLKSAPKELFLCLFFCVHYGAFCAVHGMLILDILFDVDIDPQSGSEWPFPLVFFQMLHGAFTVVMGVVPSAWMVAFGALVISHGASFIYNYLLRGERYEVTLNEVMKAPYKRVFIMHVAVILGSILVEKMGQPVFMLIALVGLKLVVDLHLHNKEHRDIEQNYERALDRSP